MSLAKNSSSNEYFLAFFGIPLIETEVLTHLSKHFSGIGCGKDVEAHFLSTYLQRTKELRIEIDKIKCKKLMIISDVNYWEK